MLTDNSTIHELDRSDIESTVLTGGTSYERFFSCPLDYNQPDCQKIQIFVRHLVATNNSDLHSSPFALYLQGGPGFQSPYQTNLTSGWIGILLSRGYQVLLLDQRGTGFSTAINAQSQVFGLSTLEDQVKYLSHFRADSIVKDCELIRKTMTAGRTGSASTKLTLLGQSFGGFCAVTYLSFFPEGIEKVLITGGLPPLIKDPVQVYSCLIPRIMLLNKKYYELHNQDVERVLKIANYLQNNKVVLPGGGIMSVRRFQQLGIVFGSSTGFSSVHKLILECHHDLETINRFSFKTLHSLESFSSFETNIIYAILHESIYCNGGVSSDWACCQAIHSNSEFSKALDLKQSLLENKPLYFTGEMIFPWMSEDYPELAKFKDLFEALASYSKWTDIYDKDALNRNNVPVAAACYYDDP
ncbi:hypothetical protein BB561_005638 [Smittium simulii]|uniref:AB hydrolase-1 domain-containing protein n=1 Tax=Smittium simulii TaxID=133385 RepID=A0A2T9Y9F9_9FUNG|nr:hypothetical protein BB561_005638 [Smittium simulii]